MRAKPALLAFAMAAVTAMAFVSSAMAYDAKIRDHFGTAEIEPERALHFVGWMKFSGADGSYSCHTSASAESRTAATGYATAFTVPDMTKCGGTGLYNGCKLESYKVTNQPYYITVVEGAHAEVSGTIIIHNEFDDCLAKKVTLTFNSVELKLLKAGQRIVAGTSNHLGAAATPKEVIAGFEVLSASGRVDIEDIFGGKSEDEITVSGELELTGPDRGTWESIEVF